MILYGAFPTYPCRQMESLLLNDNHFVIFSTFLLCTSAHFPLSLKIRICAASTRDSVLIGISLYQATIVTQNLTDRGSTYPKHFEIYQKKKKLNNMKRFFVVQMVVHCERKLETYLVSPLCRSHIYHADCNQLMV